MGDLCLGFVFTTEDDLGFALGLLFGFGFEVTRVRLVICGLLLGVRDPTTGGRDRRFTDDDRGTGVTLEAKIGGGVCFLGGSIFIFATFCDFPTTRSDRHATPLLLSSAQDST